MPNTAQTITDVVREITQGCEVTKKDRLDAFHTYIKERDDHLLKTQARDKIQHEVYMQHLIDAHEIGLACMRDYIWFGSE